MGFNPQTDIPRTSAGMNGMNQGPQGAAQGPQGAAIGQTFGSQFGMQRDQLGGMTPPAGVDNPMQAAISSLTNAPQGTGGPTQAPGGGPPTQPFAPGIGSPGYNWQNFIKDIGIRFDPGQGGGAGGQGRWQAGKQQW